MDISIFAAALKAAIMAKLTSFGAAFMAGLSVIGMGFLADERAIGVAVMEKFHATHDAAVAAGKSQIDAIEEAATAAYNEFCSDQTKEFWKESDAIITLLKSSAQSAAGL
jgi:hypothetical protein